MKLLRAGTALVLSGLFTASVASVASADEPQPQRRRRHPPPEAIKACETHAPGDACTVEFPDRTIEGTCREAPDGGEGPLACVPNRPPPPPPEDAR